MDFLWMLLLAVCLFSFITKSREQSIENVKRWYWSLDGLNIEEHPQSSQINIIEGSVAIQTGIRLNGFHLDGSAIIEVGNFTDTCFSDPTLCNVGYSVIVWLNPDPNPADCTVLTNGGDDPTGSGFWLEYNQAADEYRIYCSDDTYQYGPVTFSLDTATWSQVGFTFHKLIDTLTVLVDGSVIATSTAKSLRGSSVSTTYSTLRIGGRNINPTHHCSFRVDEVYLSDVVATHYQIEGMKKKTLKMADQTTLYWAFDYTFEGNIVMGSNVGKFLSNEPADPSYAKVFSGLKFEHSQELLLGDFPDYCAGGVMNCGKYSSAFWLYISEDRETPDGRLRYILGNVNDTASSTGFALVYNFAELHSGGGDPPEVHCLLSVVSADDKYQAYTLIAPLGTTVPSVQQNPCRTRRWMHIAFSREEVNFNIYINGSMYLNIVSGWSMTGSYKRVCPESCPLTYDNYTDLRIGSATNPSLTSFVIDEFYFMENKVLHADMVIELFGIKEIWKFDGPQEETSDRNEYVMLEYFVGTGSHPRDVAIVNHTEGGIIVKGVTGGPSMELSPEDFAWRNLSMEADRCLTNIELCEQGITIEFYLKQKGRKEANPIAYYLMSGADVPRSWGISIYSENGEIKAVVQTSVLEWRVSGPMGYNQWILFIITFHSNFGLTLTGNGIIADQTLNPSVRADPSYPTSSRNGMLYFGRSFSSLGNRDTCILDRLKISEGYQEETFSIYNARKIFLTTSFDIEANGFIPGEIPFFNYAALKWENPIYNFSISFDGTSQYLESTSCPYVCPFTTLNGDCERRMYMWGFWWKPYDITNNHTVLWAGNGLNPTVHFRAESGLYRLKTHFYDEDSQAIKICTYTLPSIELETWNHFMFAMIADKPITLNDTQVNMVRMNLPSVCVIDTNPQQNKTMIGKYYVGAAPIDEFTMGDFGHFDFDILQRAEAKYTRKDADDFNPQWWANKTTALTSCFDVMLSEYQSSSYNNVIKINYRRIIDNKRVTDYAAVPCLFETGENIDRAMTKLNHDGSFNQSVVVIPPATMMEKTLEYAHNEDHRIALMKTTHNCNQSMEYYCDNAPLFESPHGIPSWTNDENIIDKFTYWPQGEGNLTCACSSGNNTCSDPTKFCNCDNPLGMWQGDKGIITDRFKLPVTKIKLPFTAGGLALWRVGAVECISFNYYGIHFDMDIITNNSGNLCLHGELQVSCNQSPTLVQGVANTSLQFDPGNDCFTIENGGSYCMDGSITHRNGLICDKGFTISMFVKVGDNSHPDPVVIFSNGDLTDSYIFGIHVLANTTTNSDLVTYTILVAQETTVQKITIHHSRKVWLHILLLWHELLKPCVFANGKSLCSVGLMAEEISINDYTPEFTLDNSGTTSARFGCQVAPAGMTSQIYIDDFRFAPNRASEEKVEFLYYRYQELRNFTSSMNGSDWGTLDNTSIPLSAPNGLKTQPMIVGNGTVLDGAADYLVAPLQYHCLGFLYLCHSQLSLTVWINIREDIHNERVIMFAKTDSVDEYAQGISLSVINNTLWTFESVNASGYRNVSLFTASWRRWVHFAVQMSFNDTHYTSIFINGREIPFAEVQSSWVNASVVHPPGTKLMFGRSPSDQYTNMWVDDLTFHESYVSESEIMLMLARSSIKVDQISFDDSLLPFGGTYNRTQGTRMVPGRGQNALLIPEGQKAALTSQLYHECLGTPVHCFRGLTMAFWIYPNISAPGGQVPIIQASEENHGISLNYDSGNPSSPFHFKIWSNSTLFTMNFFMPMYRWNNVLLNWTFIGSSYSESNGNIWINNVLTQVTTVNTNLTLDKSHGGIVLSFSIDGMSAETYILIDEFYFQEEISNLTLPQLIYNTGTLYQNPLNWTLDNIDGTALYGDPQENGTIHGNISIIEGAQGNGLNMTGYGSWVDLTSEPFHCINDIRLCIGITISLYINYQGWKGWEINEENYFLYTVNRFSPDTGLYFMHGNLDPRLPVRHYFRIGIQRDTKVWTLDLNMEENMWTQVVLAWSAEEGLEVSVDGILAGTNTTGAARTNTDPNELQKIYLGKPDNLHTAGAYLDEIRYWDGKEATENVSTSEELYYSSCYDSTLGPFSSSPPTVLSTGREALDCRRSCDKDFRYAIVRNSNCLCIDSLDVGIQVIDALCDIPCDGLSCGGSGGQYSVYRTTANLPFPTILPITAFEVEILGKYSGYNWTHPVVDYNETFIINPNQTGGTHVVYKVDFGDGTQVTYLEQSNWTYVYPNGGLYNLRISAMNEFSEILVVTKIFVTFPLEPITDLSINTSVVMPTNTIVDYDFSVASGNHLSCNLSLISDTGNNELIQYYHKNYTNWHNISHALSIPGYYVVNLTCDNFISRSTVLTNILIEEPVNALSVTPFWIYDSNHAFSELNWDMGAGSHVFYRVFFNGTDVYGSFYMSKPAFASHQNVSIPQHLYIEREYFYVQIFAWNNISGPLNNSCVVYAEQGVIDFTFGINSTLIKTHTCVKASFMISNGTKVTHVLNVDNTNIFTLYFHEPIGIYENATILCFHGPGIKQIYSHTNNSIALHPRTGQIRVLTEILGVVCTFRNVSRWQDTDITTVSQVPGSEPPTNATLTVTYGNGYSQEISFIDLNDTNPIDLKQNYTIDKLYFINVSLINDVSSYGCSKTIQVGYPIENATVIFPKNIYHTEEVVPLGVWIDQGSNVNVTCWFGDGSVQNKPILPAATLWLFNNTYTINGTYTLNCTFSNDYGFSSWSDSLASQELIKNFTYSPPMLFETDMPFLQEWTLSSGSHISYVLYVDNNIYTNMSQHDDGGMFWYSGLPLGTYFVNLFATNDVSGTVNISDFMYIERKITGLRVQTNSTYGEANVTYSFNVSFLTGSNVLVKVRISRLDLMNETYTLLGDYPTGDLRDFNISFPQSGGYRIEVTATNRHGTVSSYLIFGIDNPILGYELAPEPGLDFRTPVVVWIVQDMNAPQPTTLLNLVVSYGDGDQDSWVGLVINGTNPFSIPHRYPIDGDYVLGAELSNQYNSLWINKTFRVGQQLQGVNISIEKYFFATLESVIFQFFFENGTNVAADMSYSDGIVLDKLATRLTWETFARPFSSSGNYSMNLTLSNAFSTEYIPLKWDIQIQKPISNFNMRQYFLYSIYSDIDINWNVLTGSHLRCNLSASGTTMTPYSCGPSIIYTMSKPPNISLPVGTYPLELYVWNEVSGPYLMTSTVQIERDLEGLFVEVSNLTPLPYQKFNVTVTVMKGSNIDILVGCGGNLVARDFADGDQLNMSRVYEYTFPEAGWKSINVTLGSPIQFGEVILWTSVSVENPIINITMEPVNTASFMYSIPVIFSVKAGTLPPSNVTMDIYLNDLRMGQNIEATILLDTPFVAYVRSPADGPYNVTAVLSNDVSTQTYYSSVIVGGLPEGIQIWSEPGDKVLTRSTFILKTTFENGSDVWMTVDFGDGRTSLAFLTAKAQVTFANIYMSQGTFNVTYKMVTSVGTVYGEYAEVYVEDPIEISDVYYSGQLMINQRIRFIARIRSAGLNYCFLWDFDNGEDGIFIVGPAACRDQAVARGATFIEWYLDEGPQSIMYTYRQVGKYKLTVIGWNRLSNDTRSLDFRLLPCSEPTVYIGGYGENARTAATYRKAQAIKLRVHAISKCSEYPRLNISCTLFKITNSTESVINAFYGEWVIQFPARYLDYGLYRLWCEVVEIHYPLVTASTEKFIDITKSPLTLRLIGGRARYIGVLSNFELDIKGSAYDPDTGESSLRDLKFQWFMKQNNKNFTNILDKPLQGMTVRNTEDRKKRDLELLNRATGFPKNRPDLIELYGMDRETNRRKRSAPILSTSVVTIYIPGATLNETVYEFMVVATLGDRSAIAYQTIYVNPGQTPTIGLLCLVNCGKKVDKRKRLTLHASCGHCDNLPIDVRYMWVLHELASPTDMNGTYISVESGLKSAVGAPYFVLKPDMLIPGKWYSVTAHLVDAHNRSLASAIYQFQTAMAPYGGRCEINPIRGVTTVTRFQITCEGWKDEGDATVQDINMDRQNKQELTYTFSQIAEGDTQEYRFSHGLASDITVTSLRPGLRELGYRVTVKVYIADLDGFHTVYPLEVTVKEVRLSREEMLSYANTSHPVYTALLTTKDMHGMVQLVSSLTDILDRPLPEEEKCICKEDSQLSDEEKALIRNGLVSVMAEAVPMVDSPEALSQAAIALAKLTDPLGVLTPDSMERASLMVKQLSGDLEKWEASKELSINSSKELIEASGDLLMDSHPGYRQFVPSPDSYGDISPFVIAQLQREKQAQINSMLDSKRHIAKSVVPNLISSIDDITMAILANDAPNEEPVLIQDSITTIRLLSVGKDDIHNQMFDIAGGYVKTPGYLSGLLLNTTDEYVFVQLYSFSRPYETWDNSVEPLSTSTIGAKILTSKGRHVHVDNLGEPVTISMNVNQSWSNPELLEAVNTKDKIKIYNVSCSNTGEIIVFPDFKDKAVEIVILLSYNKVSGNESSYDEMIILHEDKQHDFTCNGKKYLGISAHAKDKEGERTLQFNIDIRSASCNYWNIQQNRWSTDGCKMGRSSNMTQVNCLCNHMTAFAASFIVPVNAIDFNKVFANGAELLADNFTVLLTLVSIVVLYYTLVLLLRHFDQSDKEKWKLRPLLDNRSGERFNYVITIHTGSQSEAGTASNIYFRLIGKKVDSRVRLLNDGSGKGLLARNTQRYFLMTNDYALNDLTNLHIWSDNTGKFNSGSWFLKHAIVTDLQTGENVTFLCEKWLALDQDDGELQRLLPVAQPEDMRQFNIVFNSTWGREMTDGHLWFSLAWRPTFSTFTRVQRLSCCLSLLFTSMIANAMFYGQLEENEQGVILQLGPMSISPQMIYIATISTIIVFPVNFIIVFIFRSIRGTEPSEEPKEKQNKSEEMDVFLAYMSTKGVKDPFPFFHPEGDDFMKDLKKLPPRDPPKKQTKFMLPPWCLVIAYLLVAVSVVVSGFFTILYSLEWGKEKSEAWLGAMFLSLFQSVCIIQPTKVLLLALFFALVLKKSKMADDLREVNATSYEARNEINIDDIKRMKPPDTKCEELRNKRQKRLKEKEMDSILWGIGLYIIYVIIIWTIAYGHRSPNMYLATEHLTNSLFKGTFGLEEVNTLDDFEEWMTDTFTENMYPTNMYNGDSVYWSRQVHESFSRDYIRIIKPRIRQLRVEPGDCFVNNFVSSYYDECNSDYGISNDETRTFKPEWKPDQNKSLNGTGSSPWKYSSALSLRGIPFMGQWNMYPGGGYVLELGNSRYEAKAGLKALFSNHWLDIYTRAVFVEFTLYNPNVNLFTVVNILLERAGSTAILPTIQIDHLILYDYQTSASLLRLICEVIFLAFLIYQAALLFRSYWKKKTGFWKNKWNVVEFILLLLGFGSVAMFLGKLTIRKLVLADFIEKRHDAGESFNFYAVAVYDKAFIYQVGTIVFLSTLKLFRYLSFNQKMHIIAETLSRAARSLWSYAAVFVILYSAFAMLGHNWFGSEVVEFSSFISTLESQFAIILGGGDMKKTFRNSSIQGRFYYFAFTFVSICITVNILLSILNEAFGAAKEELLNKPNQYEIVDYLMQRFQNITGIKWQKEMKPEPQYAKKIVEPDIRKEMATVRAFIKKCVTADKELRKLAMKSGIYISDLNKEKGHDGTAVSMNPRECTDKVLGPAHLHREAEIIEIQNAQHESEFRNVDSEEELEDSLKTLETETPSDENDC